MKLCRKETEEGRTVLHLLFILRWGHSPGEQDPEVSLAARVACMFRVKAFTDKTSLSLKNVGRKGCWLHMDEGFFWKVYMRDNFRDTPVFSVFSCLK